MIRERRVSENTRNKYLPLSLLTPCAIWLDLVTLDGAYERRRASRELTTLPSPSSPDMSDIPSYCECTWDAFLGLALDAAGLAVHVEHDYVQHEVLDSIEHGQGDIGWLQDCGKVSAYALSRK